MLVIHGRLRVLPDKKDAFLDAARKLVSFSRAEDGVIGYGIYEDVTEPNTFTSAEVFEDEAAMERQGTSSYVAELFPVIAATLAGPLEGTVFTVSESKPLEL